MTQPPPQGWPASVSTPPPTAKEDTGGYTGARPEIRPPPTPILKGVGTGSGTGVMPSQPTPQLLRVPFLPTGPQNGSLAWVVDVDTAATAVDMGQTPSPTTLLTSAPHASTANTALTTNATAVASAIPSHAKSGRSAADPACPRCPLLTAQCNRLNPHS